MFFEEKPRIIKPINRFKIKVQAMHWNWQNRSILRQNFLENFIKNRAILKYIPIFYKFFWMKLAKNGYLKMKLEQLKIKPWMWFIILWAVGISTCFLMSLFIKSLFKFMCLFKISN
jgi:hypothetical protein